MFIPTEGTIYFSVTVKVNDPQGHLQDIDQVELILYVSGNPQDPAIMGDDGNFNDNGDLLSEDGIYTTSYFVNSGNEGDSYPFTIRATDKVGNISEEITGELIFVKNLKSKTNREDDAEKLNYSNPFNTK